MKAKILSGLVILALILAIPYGAYAAATPKAIADTYTIDGITYYNVNSQNFNSDKRFYVDVISAKHKALGGRSLGDLWLMVAFGMAKTSGHDKMINSAKDAIRKSDSRYVTAPAWRNYDGGYVETEVAIADSSYKGVHCIVRFSDFRVGALIPADEGLYVSTTNETGSVRNIEASSVKNDTSETVDARQNLSKTVAETLESTVSHSSSYSFTEGLTIGMEAGVGDTFKITGEISAQFTQAFEDGWSTSNAKTNSATKDSEVSVTLPPYTTVLIRQGDSETTTTTKYNCPVFLAYKVTVVVADYMESLPVSGGGDYTFGSANSNARTDIAHRAFDEGSKALDTQNVDWENILADNDFRSAIKMIENNIPMSGAGATVVYTNKTNYSEVMGKAALKPLTAVKLGKPNISY
ncbi:MAG: hypothetical protein IJS39_10425 [Synergistaceae bacterium]|nr:hypothetical protein [Synergistaceae bacterium]